MVETSVDFGRCKLLDKFKILLLAQLRVLCDISKLEGVARELEDFTM